MIGDREWTREETGVSLKAGQKLLFCSSSLQAVGTSHLQIPDVPVDTECTFAVNIYVLNIGRATCHPDGA